MKTSKFSETQICAILKEQDAGVKVAEICRKHGISSAAFDKWRSKYGGMDASMLKRVRELEAENASGGGSRRWTPSRRWTNRSSRRRWQKNGNARPTTRGGSVGGGRASRVQTPGVRVVFDQPGLLLVRVQTPTRRRGDRRAIAARATGVIHRHLFVWHGLLASREVLMGDPQGGEY